MPVCCFGVGEHVQFPLLGHPSSAQHVVPGKEEVEHSNEFGSSEIWHEHPPLVVEHVGPGIGGGTYVPAS
jgi:hypothetical protein